MAIIEGRTITNLAELQEFCTAAIAAAKTDPLGHPPARSAGHACRRDHGLKDGSKVYDVLTSN